MLKVRTWLTEVLLDVTNEETEKVCHEVLAREKKKKSKGSICSPNNNDDKLFWAITRGFS